MDLLPPRRDKVNPKHVSNIIQSPTTDIPVLSLCRPIAKVSLRESMPSCDWMLQREDEMWRSLFATLTFSLFGLSTGVSNAETQTAELATPGRPHANASLEWIYSCPSSKGCAFSCPGAGGGMTAAHVTKLTINLRPLRMDEEKALALFYEYSTLADYSTLAMLSGSGFAINTGLGTLACQVNGMHLDYFGPPKSRLQD